MIARPPEKNFSSKKTITSPLLGGVANDNRPPKRIFLGWIVFLAGILLFLGAAFQIFERIME